MLVFYITEGSEVNLLLVIISMEQTMTEIYSTDTDSGTISVLENDGKSVKKIASIQVGNAPRGSGPVYL